MLRGPFEWAVCFVAGGVVGAIVISYAVPRESAASAFRRAAAPAVRVLGTAAAIPASVPPPPLPTSAKRRKRASRQATIVVAATRAESWLSARAGSEAGLVLYEGRLARGETVRLRARRAWIRFGSASHVDLRIDGKLTPLPLFGTFDAFVGPHGVRPDRTIYATAAQSP